MIKKTVFVSLLFLILLLPADEGMFLPDQLNSAFIARLQELGLKIAPEMVYSEATPAIAHAIINLGGGTGSFVSREGLILTNHHVAFGAVQRQSTPEKNYLRDGFLARAKAEEIPAPGYRARIMVEFSKVTPRFAALLKKKGDPLKIHKKIDLLKKKIVQEAEKEPGIEAYVQDFFGGREFYLVKYFSIRDVRIVYVPAQSIGEYGGEIDNWMWPRHTGDFSFLRAYVGKNGQPADFSAENVPYAPKSYLRISSTPLREGDFTFIMGYPGLTSRWKCAADVENVIKYGYPERISLIKGWIETLEKASTDDAVRIKNAGILKGLYNSVKNNQGMLEGLQRFNIGEGRRAREAELQQWIRRDSKLLKRYGTLIAELDKLAAESLALSKRSQLLGWMVRGSKLLNWAITLNKLAIEKVKPDLERESGFMQRDLPLIEQGFKIGQNSYDLNTDKLVMAYFLKELQKIAPAGHFIMQEIAGQEGASGEEKIRAFIEKLYSGTNLSDLETRLSLMKKSRKEILAQGDSLIVLADRLQKELDELKESSNALQVRKLKLDPLYIEALASMEKLETIYPDANGTLRFNHGFVKGYEPRDSVVYLPFTTLRGVVEKNSGEFPFNLDPRIVKAYETQDFGSYFCKSLQGVPVNFLSTNDSTGGNSGSPVMNARGELVGLLFDGNYEAMSSDYLFIPKLTRSIHVDLRYILWVTEKIDKADNVLKELELVKN